MNKSNEQNKQFILDPLCCIVRMILLIYKPENTKISISNNFFLIVNPDGIKVLYDIGKATREKTYIIFTIPL